MGVKAHIIESRLLCPPQVVYMRFTVWRRDERQRIDIVVAIAAREEGRSIQEKAVAPHLEFAQPEALVPAVNGRFTVQQRYLGHIQNRRLGGPALRPGQRYFTGKVGTGFLQGHRLPEIPCNRTVSGFHLNVHGRIFQGAVTATAYADVYQRRRLFNITVHPHIVYPQGRRGFQFDIPVETAEAMIGGHASLAAGRVVAHRGDQLRRFARRHEIGNVILVSAAIGIQMGDAMLVYPEPGLGTHAADFQPDAFILPVSRDIHGTAVPRGSHVQVFYRSWNTVKRWVPGLAHAGFAHTLRLPAPGYGNGPAAAPVRFIPAGAFTHAVPPHKPGVGDEVPLTAQGNDLLQR